MSLQKKDFSSNIIFVECLAYPIAICHLVQSINTFGIGTNIINLRYQMPLASCIKWPNSEYWKVSVCSQL